MIIWITGISGSGKTTLTQGIYKKYKSRVKNLVCVDGDVIRDLYDNDLGYDEKSRVKQIKRIQKLCLYLESQGLIVLVAALYSNSNLMSWNKKNFKNYYEVYLKASINLVKKRDPKNLYKKFKIGEEKNIVGLDIEWEEPKEYDLLINMEKEISSSETVKKLINKLKLFSKEFSYET
ncbi:MAG: putative adenylyl-sulfate kinase [Alphaproteobacteria bacterium MarineAlpha9_Bin4]|nr:adenylylsulfate kinase [Pelagibacterales bacterium]PPR27447.1 MAG: putative adenylyl-sulfate kinase [Alphaproteobacteria bacterium MarineAlpha9_Bin4]|tara:strand:+ start:122 stop:652 length:531 start_codon:yes stop_codon:yes gene_type:complete